jgi:hypothetical protein
MRPNLPNKTEVFDYIKTSSIKEINDLIEFISKNDKAELFDRLNTDLLKRTEATNYSELVVLTLMEYPEIEITDLYWAKKYGNLRWQTHLSLLEKKLGTKLCKRVSRFKRSIFEEGKKDKYTLYIPIIQKDKLKNILNEMKIN